MWLLADSTFGALRQASIELAGGTVNIPKPAESVADWPVIGTETYEIWSSAATNLEETTNKFEPQIKSLGRTAVTAADSTLGSMFQFVLSVIIGGVLLLSASGGY